MGCFQSTPGSSPYNNKLTTISTQYPQIHKQPQQTYSKKPQYIEQLSMQNMYIIGITNKNIPLILKFNPDKQQLTSLNATQSKLNFANYSSMTCIGKQSFLISGGINLNLDEITNRCFIYNGNQNKSFAIKSMHKYRYTHTSITFDKHVYVFGGRVFGDDNHAIITQCQRYSLQQNFWQIIKPMQIKRCTGFSLIWNNQIYVFGGYTKSLKRSKTIQIYNPSSNTWRICPFKLHRGVQCGNIFPNITNNQFVLFGGNMKYGPVDSVNVYNLDQGTVHSRRSMFHARVLQKGMSYNNNVYILGGCQHDNLQICDLKTFQMRRNIHIGINRFLDPTQLEKFTHSMIPCHINSGQSTIFKQSFDYNDEIVFLFGTDSQPFILQFNISIPYAISHPVPLQMKCLSYQGGIAIPGSKFLLMGGVRDDLDRVKKYTYEYDTRTRKARKLQKMHQQRYAFPTVFNNGYVYVIGGRKQGQDQAAILNHCQRFNLTTYKWQQIDKLPVKCVSANAFVYKKKVYVTGGYNPSGERISKIFVYQQSNYWKTLQINFPFGLQASALLWKSNSQLLFFGGRVHAGDSKNIWRMTITQDYNGTNIIKNAIFNQVGQMNEQKCLHKIYHPRHQNFAVIFGGKNENILAFYDLNTNEISNSDIYSNVFSTFSNEIQGLRDQEMKTYLLLWQQNN